jgi:hypothetical protein
MTRFVLYPENIAGGIAQFGSYLAVLQGLMIVMHWVNWRQYERKLTKFLQKEKNDGL